MKEGRKTNFKQKKPFSIFVLSDKTRERNSPAFTEKKITPINRNQPHFHPLTKNKNTKFVRY